MGLFRWFFLQVFLFILDDLGFTGLIFKGFFSNIPSVCLPNRRVFLAKAY